MTEANSGHGDPFAQLGLDDSAVGPCEPCAPTAPPRPGPTATAAARRRGGKRTNRRGRGLGVSVTERDESDRLRRLSTIMRFLAQMREIEHERELLSAFIQAAAVWHDLDARAYRRDLQGRYQLDTWLPGADVASDPQSLDVQGIVTGDAPVRVTAIADLEQLGWRSLQGELLLLPVCAFGAARWVVVVAGSVERDVESTLMLVCRSAAAVIEQLQTQRTREIEQRLVRRMTETREAFQGRARGVAEEYAMATGAAGARLSVRAGLGRALTLASIGEQWATAPPEILTAGAASLAADRLAFGFALGNDAVAVIELASAPGASFTVEQAELARAGGVVLSVWLSGVSGGAGKGLGVTEAAAPPPRPFEDEMRAELERARRLSLNGGVLVASVPGSGGMPDSRVLSVLIQVVRGELRSSDLLGQLAGGDIAAVLVRTSGEGVAVAAERVRQRLDALAREHLLPPVVVGHALYPGGPAESALALVSKARKKAGLFFS